MFKEREEKQRKAKERKKKHPCYSPAEANFFLETKKFIIWALT